MAYGILGHSPGIEHTPPHAVEVPSLNNGIPGKSLYLSFCDQLTSLSIVKSLRFIHVVACARIFLLRVNGTHYVCSTFRLFIHPSMDMGCFHTFTVNSSAVLMKF